MNTSREDTGLLESKTCFTFYSQAIYTRNHPIPILLSPISQTTSKTSDQSYTTPLTSALEIKKKAVQETAPFETQPEYVDQPARVTKQIQGTLNLSPPLSAWSWHSQGTRRFFCQWSTRNPRRGSRAASTVAELFCWLSPNPVVFTAFKPGKMQGWQSKAEGNWRKEPREVLQGEALTCSQQIKPSEEEEHWQIPRLNMLSVSKSGGGTLPT